MWTIAKGFAAAGLAAAVLSCDEALPPYQDPADVFTMTMTGEYSMNQWENVVKAYVTVANRYDETFQARAVLRGRLKITWQRDTSMHKTVMLDSTNLFSTPNYNKETGVLTIDPGDTFRVRYVWNLVTDSGVDVSTLFVYEKDPSCSQRYIANTETFSLEGEFKVYERTGLTRAAPAAVSFRYLTAWIGEAACIPM